MSLKLSVLATGLLLVCAQAACAHIDPPPPPSGIVVHLFGPNGMTNRILPQSSAARAATGSAPGGVTPNNAANGVSPNNAAAAAPDMHDILHQMFITGDPNVQPGQSIPKGRSGDGSTPGN